MLRTIQADREDRVAPQGAPYLSHSRVNKYLTCPAQYRYYYIERLRLRAPAANLVFGQLIHQALAGLFGVGLDPVPAFAEAWAPFRQIPLTYGSKDSWEKLRAAGEGILRKFVAEELSKITQVEAVETPFTLDVTSLDLPFIGVLDLVARIDKKRTVVDFKTVGASYDGYEAALSDQLTAYQLARPEAEQSALCVLVKTKEPKIEWHPTRRTATDFTEYLGKVRSVGDSLKASQFFKRPGMWCSWCDYLPVCMGDSKATQEALVKIA
jgi:RecB family exonuclease